jgi:dTDP-4-amino-4,6-dideoxygalactose transaminase
LSAQLTRLDDQTRRRHENARLLDRLLGEIPGITPQLFDSRMTRNGHYAYIFHVDRGQFAGITTKRFIEAMIAEGIPNQAAYPPVHALDLFTSGAFRSRLCPGTEGHPSWQTAFPITERAAWETFWIPQYALLGDEQDMHEIATAIKKIQQHATELT